jgi:hypothetical protein
MNSVPVLGIIPVLPFVPSLNKIRITISKLWVVCLYVSWIQEPIECGSEPCSYKSTLYSDLLCSDQTSNIRNISGSRLHNIIQQNTEPYLFFYKTSVLIIIRIRILWSISKNYWSGSELQSGYNKALF